MSYTLTFSKKTIVGAVDRNERELIDFKVEDQTNRNKTLTKH